MKNHGLFLIERQEGRDAGSAGGMADPSMDHARENKGEKASRAGAKARTPHKHDQLDFALENLWLSWICLRRDDIRDILYICDSPQPAEQREVSPSRHPGCPGLLALRTAQEHRAGVGDARQYEVGSLLPLSRVTGKRQAWLAGSGRTVSRDTNGWVCKEGLGKSL